jgi:C4-dicarboxylate transporter, DctM subunit
MGRNLPWSSRILLFCVLLVALLVSLDGGAAGPAGDVADGGSSGSSGTLLVFAALVAMVLLGSPLFVIIGVLAAMCFLVFGDGDLYDPGKCATLSSDAICGFDTFPAKMAELSSKNVLLAIPFFVVSGAIMSAGDIANRLVAFAKSLVGWLPGGLAIATVGGCIFFAAISGSSPVTVIAIGSMMYPALTKAGYSDRFSMGLVTTAGSLGILIPPSIPMLVFAIVASSAMPIDVGELFMAGILPGMLIGLLLSIYSVVVAGKASDDRTPFTLSGVVTALRDGFWAVMLPILILGGIYSGLFTPTEAAAVAVIYSLVVELFIHRTIGVGHLPKILAESAVMMGTLLVIMALAFGLNDFLVEEKVPDMAVEQIQSMELTPIQFLLIINLFLLVVGALMDSISAILVIAPLLTPIAAKLGLDPVHLGVIFIVNLEIGYLTPPIGINLFVASAAFKKPMGEVMRSVVPFILLMFVGLGLVTYVPSISMGPVNVLLRGKPFVEDLPKMGDDGKIVRSGAARTDGAEGKQPGEGDFRSMQDITAVTDQLLSLCFLAEDVLEDEDLDAAQRVEKWKKGLEGEDITEAAVRELADTAIAQAGTPEAYAGLRAEASKLLRLEWKCPALETLLGPAAPPPPPEDEDEDEDEEDDDGAAPGAPTEREDAP